MMLHKMKSTIEKEMLRVLEATNALTIKLMQKCDEKYTMDYMMKKNIHKLSLRTICHRKNISVVKSPFWTELYGGERIIRRKT